MKKLNKALITLSILSTASSFAGYNQLWYMKGDLDKKHIQLNTQIEEVLSLGRSINFFKKSAFNETCFELQKLEEEVSDFQREFKERFIKESKSQKFGLKESVLESIDNLDKSLDYFSELKSDCTNESRISSSRAYEVTKKYEALGVFDKEINKLKKSFSYYVSYAGKIKNFDITKLEGAYIGHQGWRTGFKKCSVRVVADHEKLVFNYTDPDKKISKGLTYKEILSDDWADLDDRIFVDYQSSTKSCRNGYAFAEEIQYNDGELSNFNVRRKAVGKTSGLGGLARCMRLMSEDISRGDSEEFNCQSLKKLY